MNYPIIFKWIIISIIISIIPMLALIINDYRKLNKIGHPIRAKNRWTNSFFIKFVLCFYISINYLSLTIQFDPGFQYPFFLSILWIIICWNLTFEFIRKVPQHWLCLRLFWLINGLQFLISDILLFIMYKNNESQSILNKTQQVYFFIQSNPSIFLMLLGLFKPNDNDEKQYMLQDEQLSLSSDDIEKQICSIELTITEIKNDTFEIKNNVLVPINDKKDNLNEKTSPILRFHLILNQNKGYTVKKQLKDLIQLNNIIINNFENGDEYYLNISNELIENLKSLTRIFEQNQMNENQLKELQKTYIMIMTNFPSFVNEFFHFCDIHDENLIEGIREHKKKKNKNYSFKSHSSVLSLSQLKSNISKFSQEDLIKFINFIVYIISNNDLIIRINILKVDDENIVSEFIYKNNDYRIDINIKQLISFFNKDTYSNVDIFIQLKQFLQNSQNILDLKEKDYEKTNYLQNYLEIIVNDLFFYDNTFFKLFLKKILLFEAESLDNLILEEFFSLDNYEGTDFDSSIFSEKTNMKLSLSLKSKIRNNEYSIKIEGTQLNSTLNLNELRQNCNQIIQANSNIRFGNLNESLRQIIKIINEKKDISKILEILNTLYSKKNFFIFYNPYFRKLFRIGEINSEKNIDMSFNSLQQSYQSRGDISIDSQNKSMFEGLIS